MVWERNTGSSDTAPGWRNGSTARGPSGNICTTCGGFFRDSGAAEKPGRETVAAWRDNLVRQGYAAASVNAMLAAVNGYQEFCGNPQGKAKPLKCQRRVFCDSDRELDREELAAMLVENADEPYADAIAAAIWKRRKSGYSIDTTRQLAETVESALAFLPQKERKDGVRKACQRTFQALRIDVNSEFEVLYQFLEKLPLVLKPGGKAAILTFHSGEDRLVKKSFQAFARQGIYEAVAKEVIRPSPQECAKNPRAHSTKMRGPFEAIYPCHNSNETT